MSADVTISKEVDVDVRIYMVKVDQEVVDFDVTVDGDGDLIIEAELTVEIAKDFLEREGYTIEDLEH